MIRKSHLNSFLKIFFSFAALISSSVALAWGSLTGTNTHAYINEQAYEILKKDPAWMDFPFPGLEEIQAFEGVYHSGTKEGYWTGPGPDSEGKSFYAAHYYNPRTGKGGAPFVVANSFTTMALGILNQDASAPKPSAWGGHFLADMSVVYHIGGMPVEDLKANYAKQIVTTPTEFKPGDDITAERSKMSYHATFTHGENFKTEADLYLAEVAKADKEYLDWFDPWYWNGRSHSNYGSSHIEWEIYHVSHSVDAAKMKYSENWFNSPPNFLNPIADQADRAKEFTIMAALDTLKNFNAYAGNNTQGALSDAVANVATMWRASFSALRLMPLVEPDAANPSPTSGRFAVRAVAFNAADETAQDVQARLYIISGGSFVIIEPIKKVGPLSKEKPVVTDKWVIETEDIRKVKVKLDMIGGYQETPDLQYTKFEGFLEQPLNIVAFEGKYSGDVAGKIDFTLSDKSFTGTMEGANKVNLPLMGNVQPDGSIVIHFLGMINALETGTETTISGNFSGKIQDQTASGTWSGKYEYYDADAKKWLTRTLSGDWWANQKDISHP